MTVWRCCISHVDVSSSSSDRVSRPQHDCCCYCSREVNCVRSTVTRADVIVVNAFKLRVKWSRSSQENIRNFEGDLLSVELTTTSSCGLKLLLNASSASQIIFDRPKHVRIPTSESVSAVHGEVCRLT